MKRNIKDIKRDLENKENNDIIYKKDYLKTMFNEDPDILEVLGQKQKRPYPDNATDEQKKEVDEYNEKITHEQIVPWIKLNGIQKEVLNFLMYEITDVSNDRDVLLRNNKNSAMKIQYLTIMCLVHEDDMDTEYGITRADLLDYLVRDLLLGSNTLGPHLVLLNDLSDIVDKRYYSRTLTFKMRALDLPYGIAGQINRYDGIT